MHDVQITMTRHEVGSAGPGRQLLLVEDDEDLANDLAEDLQRHRFDVTHAASGAEGARLGRAHPYDVMIVDRMMPGMGGLTLIAGLRKEQIRTPVLVLSGLSGVDDRVSGLMAGGDDYLVKPYAMAELVARLEALLRRTGPERMTMLTVGPLQIDLMERRASRNGRPIDLLPREFRLLEYMARFPGRVLTREMLLKDVWNYQSSAQSNLVDVHMCKLRRKLDAPDEVPLITNVRGVGFVLCPTE